MDPIRARRLTQITHLDCVQAALNPTKKVGPPGPHPPYTIHVIDGLFYVQNSLGQKKNNTGFNTEAEAQKLQAALYAALPPGFKIPGAQKTN